MSIEVVSASAGSGKTFFLANEVAAAVAAGRARPDAVLAVTFTTRAANELRARLRSRMSELGEAGSGFEHARIGTVHSVAAGWLRDLAFHLGISPRLHVLPTLEAGELFRQALDEAAAADSDRSFMRRLTAQDWSQLAFTLADQARANGIGAEQLRHHAERSIASLLSNLPPGTSSVDRVALVAALDGMVAVVPDNASAEAARVVAADARTRIGTTDLVPWELFDRLSTLEGAASQRETAVPVRAISAAYLRDPALRDDLTASIEHVFSVAGRALTAYASAKRQLGAVDFTDLEEQFLAALGEEATARLVADSLDLFLVDEFQDSSPLQIALFTRLAELATRTVWVGDVKQAIFGFRGTDPRLMAGLARELVPTDGPRVLGQSWRSRAPLVDVTNHVFTAPFDALGIPPAQVVLEPAVKTDDRALGVIVERWRVHGDNRAAQHVALASIVTRFLGDAQVRVRDLTDGRARPAMRGDIAILCRTQASCSAVARAIRATGIEVAGPSELEAAPEVLLLIALLRLHERPSDRLSRAEVERILDDHADGSGWASRVFDSPSANTWWSPTGPTGTVGVSAQVDLILARPELRGVLAGWGQLAERLARLEVLRRKAISYEQTVVAPSISGFMDALVSGNTDDAGGSRVAPADDRVNVLTWHASKGLEWPVVVLYDLHHQPDSSPCGVSAEGPTTLVATDPLRDRALRFWPRAVSERQTTGPFSTAMQASGEGRAAAERLAQEELRLLYVAWTRARDRLVLAARPSRLTEGVLALLNNRGVPIVREPMVRATWGRRNFDIVVRESGQAAPVPGAATINSEQSSRDRRARRPARQLPSHFRQAGRVVRVDELGGALPVFAGARARELGLALHDYLVGAADRPADIDRVRIAEVSLSRHGIVDVDAAELLAVQDRLESWIDRTIGSVARLHAVPVEVPQSDGSTVIGEADLILRDTDAFAIIDHKVHATSRETALGDAGGAAAQLTAYADACAAAWQTSCRGMFVHLPVQGLVALVEPHAAGEQ